MKLSIDTLTTVRNELIKIVAPAIRLDGELVELEFMAFDLESEIFPRPVWSMSLEDKKKVLESEDPAKNTVSIVTGLLNEGGAGYEALKSQGFKVGIVAVGRPIYIDQSGRRAQDKASVFSVAQEFTIFTFEKEVFNFYVFLNSKGQIDCSDIMDYTS